MAGSGVGGDARSKEAVGMLALHESLRNICLSSDWTYSVFWTIRPRPRCRGGSGCKIGDDNGNLMLMWEDGFCRSRVDDLEGEDLVRKAFSKMSIQLYNYGEGLMGKVASDKCHKWVFKEPSESEPNISNYWQSSFDALPPEWNDQFSSGIQTIAVIQAGNGLLQLGSCKIIPEDLHFVLKMRHMFESLGYQSGFFLSQLFSSTRSSSPSPSAPAMKQIPTRPPPSLFNWSSHPSLASVPPPMAPPLAFHHSSAAQMAATIPSNNKDDAQLFLIPPSSSEAQMNEMMQPPEHESDLKWPNGLSFFTALTGRTDDAKLLFGAEILGHKPPPPRPGIMMPVADQANATDDVANDAAAAAASEADDELLSSECHSHKARKMESSSSKFKRLPARMSTSSSSSSLEQQHHHHHAAATTPQQMDYRGAEAAGIYQDIMETFLD